MLLSEKNITHRSSKYFKYYDPLSLDKLNDHFKEYCFLEIKGKNLKGVTELLKHDLKIIEHTDEFLKGVITFKERKKEISSDTYYMKLHVFNFMFLKDPSVLILHGSSRLMNKIIDGFDHTNEPKPPNDNPKKNNSFFGGYGDDQHINKYVIKKITKEIERVGENILYDPHFMELTNSQDNRGGECFYRNNDTSATLDEKFCYLFELCTYWQPELRVHNCGGIRSESPTKPYKMSIKSDFSFTFSYGVKVEQLNQFWSSVIIPIIKFDNYDEEKKDCLEEAKMYSELLEKIKNIQ